MGIKKRVGRIGGLKDRRVEGRKEWSKLETEGEMEEGWE